MWGVELPELVWYAIGGVWGLMGLTAVTVAANVIIRKWRKR